MLISTLSTYFKMLIRDVFKDVILKHLYLNHKIMMMIFPSFKSAHLIYNCGQFMSCNMFIVCC